MVQRRHRMTWVGGLTAALIALGVAFTGFALYSTSTFTLASVAVSETGDAISARNAQTLTLKSTWSRTFHTTICRFLSFSSKAGGNQDRVAVGTLYREGRDGSINILNARGGILWSYAVPDGECIYSTPHAAFDGFQVDLIHVYDINEDGLNEILVSFVHNHFEPCKLMVFDLEGRILGEYWHPGYIRTIASGRVGGEGEILVVLSASNNAINSEWWHPQTLFAFRATDIQGQGPPYDYLGSASRPDIRRGAEL